MKGFGRADVEPCLDCWTYSIFRWWRIHTGGNGFAGCFCLGETADSVASEVAPPPDRHDRSHFLAGIVVAVWLSASGRKPACLLAGRS